MMDLLGPIEDPARNRHNLNESHPHTEIFSKRRKICSNCVEDLSCQKMNLLTKGSSASDQAPLKIFTITLFHNLSTIGAILTAQTYLGSNPKCLVIIGKYRGENRPTSAELAVLGCRERNQRIPGVGACRMRDS